MAKVKNLLGDRSSLTINPLDVDELDQNKLWVHYDPEADSIVIYITGAPVRAISVHVGNDTYLKVDPKSGDVVGFHIEAWTRNFVPEHPEVQSVWNKMQPDLEPAFDWNHLLRMLALWVIFIFKSDHTLDLTPQPV
jgi:uncharacterized protein YuzE